VATAYLCVQGSLADRTLRAHEESFRRRLQAVAPGDAQALALIRADQAAFEDAYRFNGRRFYVLNVAKPLISSAMALLGFYITYAAYRAFRVHSREAAVMLVAALIVVLGRDPIGAWLTRSPAASPRPWLNWISLPNWAEFVVNFLSNAFQRGVGFGLSIAVLAVALRIWLGRERGLVEPPQL
jgi:hypothetical protein